MPTNFVPLTRMRLKPYIVIKAIRGGAFLGGPSDFPAFLAANASKFVVIGAVEKLTENQERAGNAVYRELNAQKDSGSFGKPVESYPGLPSYSLELTRVVLHDANLQEVFGFIGSDIVEQIVPLIIQIVKPVPIDPNTGSPIVIAGVPQEPETRTYFGCWFDKNSMEFDSAAGDLKLAQTVICVATGLVSSKTTVS